MHTGTSEDSDKTLSTLDSQESQEIINLPKLCLYYKFFLVEELVLEADYRQLHYGLCSLIGKLRQQADGHFTLENIRLPHFPREYSLPEGTLVICLLINNFHGDKLQHGRYCNVCGEVKLLNEQNSGAAILTSHEVHLQLARLTAEHNATERQTFLRQLQSTYKPAINLHYLHEIDRAGELAERNLEIRMLTNH